MSNKDFTEFLPADLEQLPALQPPDWGNLVPRFSYFIKSSFCEPFKITENGQLAAIGTRILHADTVWLACIVVHPEHRNKGLGNRITSSLIHNIDRNTYKAIYLDATEYGYPVYRKLGFEVEAEYIHLHREKEPFRFSGSECIVPFEEKYRQQVFEIDEFVSGEKRSGVLGDYLTNSSLYVSTAEVQGFYIPDWSEGPVIAKNQTAGTELLKLRIQEFDSAVVPAENQATLNFLQENSYKIYKTSRRMFLGNKIAWQGNLVFNWINGQLG
jgi:N-acetylglutamate synthase-like GNAT family acetyltransferase